MKKLLSKQAITFYYFVCSLLLIVLTTYLGMQLSNGYGGLIAGILIIAVSVLLYFIFNKKKLSKLFVFVYILNSVGIGLSLSTLYIKTEVSFNLFNHIDIQRILLAICIISLFSLLMLFSAVVLYKKEGVLYYWLTLSVHILALITFTVFWIANGNNITCSLLFFFEIIALSYHILYLKVNSYNNLFKKISAYSFGLYFIITLIVLIVISEGDFSGFDGGIGGLDIGPNKSSVKRDNTLIKF